MTNTSKTTALLLPMLPISRIMARAPEIARIWYVFPPYTMDTIFGMLCILLICWYVMHTHKGMKCKLEIYYYYLKLQEIHFKY